MKWYEETLAQYEENPGVRTYEMAPGVTSDQAICEKMKEILGRDEAYHGKIAEVLEQTKTVRMGLLLSGTPKEDYQYRYQQVVASIYGELDRQVTLKAEPIYGWQTLFSYEGDFLFLMVAVLFCTSFSVLNERQNGFFAISGLCRRGRGDTVVAKILALVILFFMILLVFTLSNVITAGVLWKGFSNPLQGVQALSERTVDLALFPFRANMIEAYLFLFFLRFMAILLLFAFVFAVCAITKRIWSSLVLGMGYILLSQNLGSLLPAEGFSGWKYLNLRDLFSPQGTIVRFRAVELLDRVVDLNAMLILLAAGSLVLAAVISVAVWAKRGLPAIREKIRISPRELFTRITGKKKLFKPFGGTGFLFHEFFKLRALFLVLLLLVGLKVYDAKEYYQKIDSAYERMYEKYLDSGIGGPYSEEKAQKIRDDLRYYAQITGKVEQMYEGFMNKTVSSVEYKAFMDEYSVAEVMKDVLENLQERAIYLGELQEKEGITGYFLYETGYGYYVSRGVDWFLLVFLALVALRMYLTEFEKNNSGSSAYHVIQTTPRGREEMFGRKLLSLWLIAVPVTILFYGIDLYYLTKGFSLPELSAPAVSLSIYRGMLGSMSLRDWMVASLVLRVLGMLLYSAAAFLAAFWTKQPFRAYALTASLLFIPHFAQQSGISICEWIDITMFFDVDRMMRTLKPALFGLYFAVGLILTALFLSKAAKKTKGGQVV